MAFSDWLRYSPSILLLISYYCPSEGDKHGGRKLTETSVTEFCARKIGNSNALYHNKKNAVELKHCETLSCYRVLSDDTKTLEGKIIFNFGLSKYLQARILADICFLHVLYFLLCYSIRCFSYAIRVNCVHI